MTLVAMCVVVTAYALMQTMLVPTLTVVQHDLGTTTTLASWAVLSAPLLVSAVTTPLIGRLGDYHGKRRVTLWVLAIYLFAAAGAGVTGSPSRSSSCRSICALTGACATSVPSSAGLSSVGRPGIVERPLLLNIA